MSLFPSLPQPTHLADVFRQWPQNFRPLLEYHDLLLREESPLSIAEREMIAAYVSGLNACTFCYGSHKIIASKFGIDESLLDKVLENIDNAPIPENLKPILHYVGKLTRLPAKLTPADSEKVFKAGWSERALFDAVQVCALFNFMNRLVEGAGVTFDYDQNDDAAEELRTRSNHSYQQFGKKLGIS